MTAFSRGGAIVMGLCGLLLCATARAEQAQLTAMDYSTLPGNKVQITLTLNAPAPKPSAFTIDNPARLAVDLPNTSLAVSHRDLSIGVGGVQGVTTAEAGGRTRVVVKLDHIVPYQAIAQGNKVYIRLNSENANAGEATTATRVANNAQSSPGAGGGANSLKKIDFRRGTDGSGQIILELSNPSTPVDVERQGGRIVANVLDTSVPDKLQRRLDVTDFATPVKTVDTVQDGKKVKVTITPIKGKDFDQVAYQTGTTFTIELKPVSKEEQARRQLEHPKYTGQRLSLNFQNIEVRSVLQLIAEFTGLNIVVSDSVKGSITLRLQNVPWDQALHIILQTKGLGMRKEGNVILVAPAAEIAAREKLELESHKQIQNLEPLQTQYFQINFAKASDIAKLLKTGKVSLLSDRGNVTVDQRTNTLIVRDTASSLDSIRQLIEKLDVPVKQVLIESRIVIASDKFSRDLGVRFGYSATSNQTPGNNFATVGGTNTGSTNYGGITGFEVPAGSGNEGLITDLPVTNPAGAIGLAVGRIGSHLLQLELSAMESQNEGDIISSPRVITANQKAATIEQGVEIPYQRASSSGATSVSFKKAVLGLTVTPQITPDDKVILDLKVSKDSRGQDTTAGPAINTQSVTTQVLVDNGETVVLGGVYERTNTHGVDRVPFFGELPLLGALFRRTTKTDDRSELLIFVTPKILKQSLNQEE